MNIPWNKFKNKEIIGRINGILFALLISFTLDFLSPMMMAVDKFYFLVVLEGILNGANALELFFNIASFVKFYPFIYFLLFKLTRKSVIIYFTINVILTGLASLAFLLGILGMSSMSFSWF